MSEVHRYSVVKMLTEAGNKITYDPHGPEVVLASEYDALAQRCRELEKVSDDAIVRNTFLETECDDLRAEVERMRQALRNVITAAGGSTTPEVSSEFLEGAAGEVLELRGQFEQQRISLRAEVDRLRNPSDDMLVAGQEVWARGRIGALEDCEEARAIYMVMIDAAMEAPR